MQRNRFRYLVLRVAAERCVRRLRDRIELLREFPEVGHRIRKRSNVRALVEHPIIIVYAVLW